VSDELNGIRESASRNERRSVHRVGAEFTAGTKPGLTPRHAPTIPENTRRPGEHVAVDVVLTPRAVVLGRAEVLKVAEAGDSVEAAKRIAAGLADVHQVDVEAAATAGPRLRGRERHPHPVAAALADELQQRPLATAKVEHAAAGANPDALGDMFVLSPLRLLQRQREVAVVLGTAEIR
jgi:hypothetical protein